MDEHGGGRFGGGGCRARGLGGVGGADERDGEALALDPGVLAGIRPQARGIGVDPEDDLRLARRDGGGEPGAERGRR